MPSPHHELSRNVSSIHCAVHVLCTSLFFFVTQRKSRDREEERERREEIEGAESTAVLVVQSSVTTSTW